MARTLTIKQEKFCNKYLECGNASEAYRYAYDCSKMNPATVHRKAAELLNNGKITARLDELRAEWVSKSDITKERVLTELSAILNSKISDYVTLEDGALKFKDFSDLTEDQIRAIEGIKYNKYGIELTLHGKSWTIARICSMLGFDAPVKNEHSGPDGAPIPMKMDYSSLSDEDLLTANKIIQKALNGSDK